MRPTRLRVAGFVAVSAALIISCTDRPAPTGVVQIQARRSSENASCTLTDVVGLVTEVFGTSDAKLPNTNSALGKLDVITKKLAKNTSAETLDAQAHARELIEFIRLKAYELAVKPKAQKLIEAIECYVGLTANTVLLMPLDATTTFVSSSGTSGIQFPADAVDTPTLVTITELPVSDSGLLHTQLDKYPGFISITQSGAADGNALRPDVRVWVEVCPTGVTDPDVLGRLRLGHQSSSGFEITPQPENPPTVLDCVNRVARATDKPSGWLRSLASLVLPKPLYARIPFGSGGVGGTAGEFSPFGPVDPYLNFSGGVGGTAGEFLRADTPGASTRTSGDTALRLNTRAKSSTDGIVLHNTGSACTDTVGAVVPKKGDCRPYVLLETAQKHAFVGVPITFRVGASGGKIAVDNPAGVDPDCDATMLDEITSSTNAKGHAQVCWTLGATAQDYTVTAKPAVPANDAFWKEITFSQAEATFTITATRKAQPTPVVVSAPAGFISLVYLQTVQLTASGGEGDGAVTFATTSNVCTVTEKGEVKALSGTGECLVTATRAQTDVYLARASEPFPIPLAKDKSTVSVSGDALFTYSGTAQGPATVEKTGSSKSVVVSYSGTGTTSYGPAPTRPTNAGDYNFTATVEADDNFLSASATMAFVIDKADVTVGNAACGGPYKYTGEAQRPSCTSSNSGPGTITGATSYSFSNNVDAGVASVTASYEGDLNHRAATGTGTFTIEAAASSISWSPDPDSIKLGTPLGSGQLNAKSPQEPGTYYYDRAFGALLPAGSNTLTVTFTPTSKNYLPSTGSATIKVRYVQVGCFASPVYSVMPQSKSYQKKGSNVPIKCTLTNAQGVGVLNATGDLLVQDIGTDFVNRWETPKTVFDQKNVFKVSGSGNYAYGLDTSPLLFVIGHYYQVTASWNDGSTTTGFFYVK